MTPPIKKKQSNNSLNSNNNMSSTSTPPMDNRKQHQHSFSSSSQWSSSRRTPPVSPSLPPRVDNMPPLSGAGKSKLAPYSPFSSMPSPPVSLLNVLSVSSGASSVTSADSSTLSNPSAKQLELEAERRQARKERRWAKKSKKKKTHSDGTASPALSLPDDSPRTYLSSDEDRLTQSTPAESSFGRKFRKNISDAKKDVDLGMDAAALLSSKQKQFMKRFGGSGAGIDDGNGNGNGDNDGDGDGDGYVGIDAKKTNSVVDRGESEEDDANIEFNMTFGSNLSSLNNSPTSPQPKAAAPLTLSSPRIESFRRKFPSSNHNIQSDDDNANNNIEPIALETKLSEMTTVYSAVNEFNKKQSEEDVPEQTANIARLWLSAAREVSTLTLTPLTALMIFVLSPIFSHPSHTNLLPPTNTRPLIPAW